MNCLEIQICDETRNTEVWNMQNGCEFDCNGTNIMPLVWHFESNYKATYKNNTSYTVIIMSVMSQQQVTSTTGQLHIKTQFLYTQVDIWLFLLVPVPII